MYDTYAEAQRAVDVLAKGDFPVQQVSIVGSDLKSVERVTGKLTYPRAAIAGAASGAWLGLFLGLVLVIFSPATTSFAIVGAALLIGAGFGMLFSLVTYSLNRRRRDFTSTMQVIATSYSVVVGAELVHKARNVLGVQPPTRIFDQPTDVQESVAPSSPGIGEVTSVLGGEKTVTDQPDAREQAEPAEQVRRRVRPPAPSYGEKVPAEGDDQN